MKKLWAALIICVFASTSVAGSMGKSHFDILGDDLFPWPWGTECPFPWREIGGGYVIHGVGPYNGHFIDFELASAAADDMQFLKIKQYDKWGTIFAEGKVYSSREQRIVRGILRTVKSQKDMAIIVRSYVKDTQKSCFSKQAVHLVKAITFCPMRGRQKCLENANYTLEKIDNNLMK